MTTKEKRTIISYLKLCFPLCGPNVQRIDELSELIVKLKTEVLEEEEEQLAKEKAHQKEMEKIYFQLHEEKFIDEK